MGLVKTRRLAAMQKQQRGNLRPMPKKGGDRKQPQKTRPQMFVAAERTVNGWL